MKKALMAVFAVFLFAFPAVADEYPDTPYGRANGDYVPADSATQTSFSWGYDSKAVRVCLDDDSALMYVRLGTVAATSSSVFIDGSTGILAGSAIPVFGGGDGTDAKCHVLPVRARSLTVHVVTAGTSSAQVTAFGQ